MDAAVVVGGAELVEGHVVFLGVGVEDVGELGRLALGGDATAGGTVSGEAGFGVESGFGHPPLVVFFHGGEDGLSEQIFGGWLELSSLVDSDCEIGEERGLCSA